LAISTSSEAPRSFWLAITALLVNYFNRSGAFPPRDIFRQQVVPIFLYYYNYFLAVGHPNPLGWHWSLAVEEQFYFVFPWFLLLVPASRARTGLILAGLALITFVARPLAVHNGRAEVPYIRFSTHLMIDCLLYGIVLYQGLRAETGPLRWLRSARLHVLLTQRWVPWLLIAVIGFSLPHIEDVAAIGYPLVNLSSALLVLSAIKTPGTLFGPLADPLMLWIGRRSYGIYLAHVPMMWLTREAIFRAGPMLHAGPRFKFIAWALGTAVVCAVLHRFVEQPLIRVGARLLAPAGGRP
jgi:peptidoglycan/LPS O-acetylase OafA/YrhL